MASSGFKFIENSIEYDLEDRLIPLELFQDVYAPGGLWGWGRNANGQLGLGDTVNRSSPVQVGSLTNWKSVQDGGSFSHAIKTDGTLWWWGTSTSGDLTNWASHTPIQIGTLTNWKQISSENNYALAIKTDGTLWAWGENSWGHLGLGDTVQRSTPVQVGNLTNWKSVSTVNNNGTVLAIKTDGTLWGWGYGGMGQLGLGNTLSYSSPVQVGTLTNWKYVDGGYSISAIKTDGTLWAWGGNYFGQLGLGDLVHRSSPVQVGSLTNWKSVCSGDLAALAIKTDGTLWGWGGNSGGQIGNGLNTPFSSPVQVGSLTNWKIAITDYSGNSVSHSMAIKTDGTLWSWGYNTGTIGQLGLGLSGSDTVRLSPVQVGSLTNWKSVSIAVNSSLAIK